MNLYDVLNTSLVSSGASNVAESKILLWSADGTTISSSSYTSAGSFFIRDGGGASSSYTDSQAKLYTFSPNWSLNQKLAFETTIYPQVGTENAYVSLWDMTTNLIVSNSQVSSPVATATVIRSTQFTLVPSHQYGVTIWSQFTGHYSYLSDASLIVFPN